MLIIILLVLICIICWALTIINCVKDDGSTAGIVAIMFSFLAAIVIGIAIGMSNPTAKMIEDLSLQREIIVDGLENTNNEYLYTKFYMDAQELNVNKHRYENKKNSLWVGCFQDRRYEYVDYINLEKENKND